MHLLVENLGEFVLGEMKDLESRVAGHDPHDGVGQSVAGQIQLLHLVKIDVRVECRQAGQVVLGQIQRPQSASSRTTIAVGLNR